MTLGGQSTEIVRDDIFGRNSSLTTSFQDVWANGGTLTYPTSNVSLTIESSSLNDTLAGSGVQKVSITLLKKNGQKITIEAEMNGTTQVNLSETGFRVLQAKTKQAGSGNQAAGNIDIKDGSNILARIATGENQTQKSQWTINTKSKMKRFFLQSFDNKKVNARLEYKACDVDFWFLVRPLDINGDHISIEIDEEFNAMTDFRWRAKAGSAGGEITAGYVFV